MKVKRLIMVFISSFILLSTLTINCMGKTTVDKSHAHYEHDSIIHIHKHSHSGNTHTHYHSSSSISVLDHLTFESQKLEIDILEKDFAIFDLSNLNSNQIKNELFKPPRFS